MVEETVNVTVQLALALSAPPDRLSALPDSVAVPPHVVAAPDPVRLVGSVAEPTAIPLRAVPVFGLVTVRVSVAFPPEDTDVGLNAALIVGTAR
ncbi:hypothetical protein D9M73_125620 [compost metagenome]